MIFFLNYVRNYKYKNERDGGKDNPEESLGTVNTTKGFRLGGVTACVRDFNVGRGGGGTVLCRNDWEDWVVGVNSEGTNNYS